jgi:hypothetical protein
LLIGVQTALLAEPNNNVSAAGLNDVQRDQYDPNDDQDA